MTQNGMDYYGPYGYGTPPPWQDSDDTGGYLFESPGPRLPVYPCDRGTGRPVGYHEFAASDNGVVVCRYCGKNPPKN